MDGPKHIATLQISHSKIEYWQCLQLTMIYIEYKSFCRAVLWGIVSPWHIIYLFISLFTKWNPTQKTKCNNTKEWFHDVIFLTVSLFLFHWGTLWWKCKILHSNWLQEGIQTEKKKDKTSLGLQLLTYMYKCLTMLLSSASQSPDKAGHWTFVSHNQGLFLRYRYQNKSQTQGFEQLNVSQIIYRYTSNDLEKL